MNKKQKRPLAVYFDTNIFGDLVEPKAVQWLNIIESKISEKYIRIIPSWETIQEMLFTPDHIQSQQRKNLYCRIVDWSDVLKPVYDILKDDILSFAHTGNSAISFIRPDHSLWSKIDSIKHGKKLFSETTIKELGIQNISYNQGYINRFLKRVNPERAKQVCENMKKHNSNEKMQWLCVWQKDNTAYIRARENADYFNVLKECEVRGIDKLLQIPTIRLTIGYTLHCWFMQTFHKKNNFEISDAVDARHIICAGAVGNIVTKDKRLKAAIEHIPDHNVKVWSLSEFIDYCVKSFPL